MLLNNFGDRKMSVYSASKERKLERRSKKKSFVRNLNKDVWFYGFFVILTFSTMALIKFLHAAFVE
jgi:hypothetical protein